MRRKALRSLRRRGPRKSRWRTSKLKPLNLCMKTWQSPCGYIAVDGGGPAATAVTIMLLTKT
eukprot:16291285-Heterocapsa_arctica.AAC.1